MAQTDLWSLPCELLHLIGQNLAPTDLTNYLIAVTGPAGVSLTLADFTTVLTKDYATLPDRDKVEFDTAKAKPFTTPGFGHAMNFVPDLMVVTLVNGVRHGPVKFYCHDSIGQSDLTGPDCQPSLVGHGHYHNDLKTGAWFLSRSYSIQEDRWLRTLECREEGNYQSNQRDGFWTISCTSQRVMLGRDLTTVTATTGQIYYRFGVKWNQAVIQRDDGVKRAGLVEITDVTSITGNFVDDSPEGVWFYNSALAGQSLHNYHRGICESAVTHR